jgi:hypothetical protein
MRAPEQPKILLAIKKAPLNVTQTAAWVRLWRWLLAEEDPERSTPKKVEAPGAAIPEASENGGLSIRTERRRAASISSTNREGNH